jgi:hypothetical protein
VVRFSPAAVFPDGLLRVGVYATTFPDAVPEFACPNVPRVPRAPLPPAPGRSADL